MNPVTMLTAQLTDRLLRTPEPPTMTPQDIEAMFGWTRRDRDGATRRGFPRPHATSTGEALWRRTEVERWAHARGLPDPKQVIRARLQTFWLGIVRTIGAVRDDVESTQLQAMHGWATRRVTLAACGRGDRFVCAIRDHSLVLTTVTGDVVREQRLSIVPSGTTLAVLVDGREADAAGVIEGNIRAWLTVIGVTRSTDLRG